MTSSDSPTDEFTQRLKALAMTDSATSSPPSSLDDVISAFHPSASRHQRMLATISLSNLLPAFEKDHTLLFTSIESSISTSPLATLRLLSALSTLSGPIAHSLLLDPSPSLLLNLLDIVLSSASQQQLSITTALDLLSNLSNHTPSRKLLSSLKIKGRTLPEWLEELSDLAELNAGSAQGLTYESGMWATLLLHKLYRSASVPGNSAEVKKASKANAVSLYSLSKARLGLDMDHPSSSAPSGWSLENWADQRRSSLLAALEALTYLTLERTWKDSVSLDAQLLKRIISVSSSMQRREVFPSRLVQGGDGKKSGASSYELDSFLGGLTSSTSSSSTSTSNEVPDSAVQYGVASILSNLVIRPRILTDEEKNAKRLRDLANKKQREAERKAEGRKGGERIEEVGEGGEVDEEQEEDEKADVIDERVRRIVDAGAAAALVAMALSGSGGGGPANRSSAPNSSSAAGATSTPAVSGLTSSPLVRQSVTECFLSLTSPQEKLLRGKLIQQGLVPALLRLCSVMLALLSEPRSSHESSGGLGSTTPSSNSGPIDSSTFSPSQSLSRLVISHPPSLVFGSDAASASAILPLASMLLHPSSTRLQRFEAALALTNLASVGEEGAKRVANAALPRPTSKSNSGEPSTSSTSDANGGSTTGPDQPRLRDQLFDLIISEENIMARRSFVELLCNLVQDEETFALWSGGMEDEVGGREGGEGEGGKKGMGKGKGKGQGKAERRLHLLVALCAPALEGQSISSNANANDQSQSRSAQGNSSSLTSPLETSLKTRLAASGALASLVSSPSACRRLLDLPRPRTLNLLARLVRAGTGLVELSSEEEEGEERGRITELGIEDDEETLVGDARQVEEDEVDEEEEAEAEERDWASHGGGREMGRAELEIRGVSIAHCLALFLVWERERREVGEKERREGRERWKRFRRAGILEALRARAVDGAREMADEARGLEGAMGGGEREKEMIRGMRRQSTQLAFEALKALKDGGLMS